jgi:hypothetical protein
MTNSMPFALVDTRRCFNLDICFDPMEVVNTCVWYWGLMFVFLQCN